VLDVRRMLLLLEVARQGSVTGAARAMSYTPRRSPSRSHDLRLRPVRRFSSAIRVASRSRLPARSSWPAGGPSPASSTPHSRSWPTLAELAPADCGSEGCWSESPVLFDSTRRRVVSCAAFGESETIKALVVLASGEHAEEGELIAWCKDRLAGHKAPTSIEFRDSWTARPLGSSRNSSSVRLIGGIARGRSTDGGRRGHRRAPLNVGR